MAQVYRFTDENGQVRLMAEIDPAPGGGYTPPTTREWLTGNAVAINNGQTLQLTWDTVVAGTALLDLTVPNTPTIVTAGVYAVSLTVEPSVSLTAGGYYQLQLDMGTETGEVVASSPAASAANGIPDMALCMVWYCPAGSAVIASVSNHDGVAQRSFFLGQANVQRIS